MESQPITKEDPPLTRKIKKHFAWKKEQETQALGKKAQGPGKKEEKTSNIVQVESNRACSNCRDAADVHHAKHDKHHRASREQ